MSALGGVAVTATRISRGRRRVLACMSICAVLAAVSPAQTAWAQHGGGGGGGHGGGGGGGHGGGGGGGGHGGGGGGHFGGGGGGHVGGGGGHHGGGGGYRGGGYYGGGWGGDYYDQPGLDFGVFGGCDPALIYRRDGRRYGYDRECY